MKRFGLMLAAAGALMIGTAEAHAQCDSGEMVIKFSHVVAENSPKGKAAKALADRVNDEMNGKACMEVYPNSTLYDDDKVMEALHSANGARSWILSLP